MTKREVPVKILTAKNVTILGGWKKAETLFITPLRGV